MFEIKAKDMRGRVGLLKTNHGDVKTPNLMPVIHPRKQTINVMSATFSKGPAGVLRQLRTWVFFLQFQKYGRVFLPPGSFINLDLF